MRTSTPSARTGLRLAKTPRSLRRWSNPCSGRTAARSYSGEPTAASSTASALRHAASVSGGSGSPHSRMPGPPNGRSSISSSSGSARSARIASRITSGPMPSPPRQTIFITRLRFAGSDGTLRSVRALMEVEMNARAMTAVVDRTQAEEVDREFAMLIDGEWVVGRVGRDVLLRRPVHRGGLGARADRRRRGRRPCRPRSAARLRRGRLAADDAGRARRAAPTARPADRGERRRAHAPSDPRERQAGHRDAARRERARRATATSSPGSPRRCTARPSRPARRTSSATRCASRSASSRRSRPGTRRSACSAGSSSPRSPQGTRWSSSRPR